MSGVMYSEAALGAVLRAGKAAPPKLGWWRRFVQGWRDLGMELRVLHSQPVYLANTWGFVPVQACLGVFTFWGPKVR